MNESRWSWYVQYVHMQRFGFPISCTYVCNTSTVVHALFSIFRSRTFSEDTTTYGLHSFSLSKKTVRKHSLVTFSVDMTKTFLLLIPGIFKRLTNNEKTFKRDQSYAGNAIAITKYIYFGWMMRWFGWRSSSCSSITVDRYHAELFVCYSHGTSCTCFQETFHFFATINN